MSVYTVDSVYHDDAASDACCESVGCSVVSDVVGADSGCAAADLGSGPVKDVGYNRVSSNGSGYSVDSGCFASTGVLCKWPSGSSSVDLDGIL